MGSRLDPQHIYAEVREALLPVCALLYVIEDHGELAGMEDGGFLDLTKHVAEHARSGIERLEAIDEVPPSYVGDPLMQTLGEIRYEALGGLRSCEMLARLLYETRADQPEEEALDALNGMLRTLDGLADRLVRQDDAVGRWVPPQS